MAAKSGWIDQAEVKRRESLLGRMASGRMSVYVKKFEILQKETSNSAVLSDCVPVIMELITCDLNVDKVLRQSLLRSLVQMVLSSETVVRKLSVTWQTDVLMGDLLKVMREHVMTQYKHYQLYAHGVVAVMKCLARSMKNNKTKENHIINTSYLVGKDSCTILDVLLKPMQYLINMNSMFNDLGCMLLDHEDTNYLNEIKRYLYLVFNKIQNKLDLVSDIVEEIVKCYEKNRSADNKWKMIKEKLKKVFDFIIVKPCSFTMNLYMNYYFFSEQQLKDYLNTLAK